MKISVLLLSFWLSFFLNQPAVLAQSDFSIYLRGGASLKDESTELKYWKSGWNIGTGCEYELTSIVQVSGDFIFHKFNLDENSWYKFMNWQTIPVGMHGKLSGESSNIYEASFAIRFVNDEGIVRPFIKLSSGIYFIRTGQFNCLIQGGDPPAQPPYAPEILYKVDAQQFNRWFMSLGIGVQISVNYDWNILVESAFSQTVLFDFTLFPINAIVQYKL